MVEIADRLLAKAWNVASLRRPRPKAVLAMPPASPPATAAAFAELALLTAVGAILRCWRCGFGRFRRDLSDRVNRIALFVFVFAAGVIQGIGRAPILQALRGLVAATAPASALAAR